MSDLERWKAASDAVKTDLSTFVRRAVEVRARLVLAATGEK